MAETVQLAHNEVKGHPEQEAKNTSEFYKNVASLCLFFESSSVQQFKSVLSWAEEEQKHFKDLKVLVFLKGKLPDIEIPPYVNVMTRKDFTIWGGKKKSVNDWLEKNKFDVMVAFAPFLGGKSRKLAQELKAKLKIGPCKSGQTELLYQVNIGCQSKMEYTEFYNWVKQYYLQLNFNQNTNGN